VNQWVRLALSRSDHYTFDLPPVGTLKELSMTLSERLREWSADDVAKGLQTGLQKGRQEGRQEGLQVGLERGQEEGARQGAARALLALLNKRFGPPSAALQTRIHAATHLQIEAWFDQALDADSLSQVF
jgi:flagellar biosynthesis/type III secretory pathway protein FliH